VRQQRFAGAGKQRKDQELWAARLVDRVVPMEALVCLIQRRFGDVAFISEPRFSGSLRDSPSSSEVAVPWLVGNADSLPPAGIVPVRASPRRSCRPGAALANMLRSEPVALRLPKVRCEKLQASVKTLCRKPSQGNGGRTGTPQPLAMRGSVGILWMLANQSYQSRIGVHGVYTRLGAGSDSRFPAVFTPKR
jgi:hypothetical protein